MTQKFQGFVCFVVMLAACGGGSTADPTCTNDQSNCGGEGGQSESANKAGGFSGSAGAGGMSSGGANVAGANGGDAGGLALGGSAGGMAGTMQSQGGVAGSTSMGGAAGMAAGGSPGVFVGDTTKPWNFLFVGNSFTFNSGIAGKLKDMLNQGQTTIKVSKSDLSVNWYRGLYFHWNFGNNVNGGNTLAMIRAKTYTHVALQDFMLHPTAKAEINKATGEGTYGVDVASDYGKRFIDEVKKDGQVPIVWAIWPEQGKQTDWEALILAYKKIAQDNGAVFVPASASWLLALKERPNLPLWDADRFHPSSMGGYACACVFYAVLTGKSPVGNPYTSGIDAATAKFLQEKAWQAYETYGIKP
jgi:hypothetical protein